MEKYRRKPVLVEAVRWDGCNHAQMAQFINNDPRDASGMNDDGTWSVPTQEGIRRVNQSDWIIKGVAGEFRLCRWENFEQDYEPAS